ALFWNPTGAPFEAAWSRLGVPDGILAIIGGSEVFGMFLDRYDVFHLSRAPGVWLPGGRPVFPEVPARTPEEVLTRHGLKPGPLQVIDADKGVTLVAWH